MVMDPCSFSYDDVLNVLLSIDPSGAVGPDDIHPCVLKNCAVFLAYPLLLIFEKSLSSGVLPVVWKDADVTPLFKKGSRYVGDNYRGVSLTSVCCKSMERLLKSHAVEYLEVNGLLSEFQFGFRKGRSTEDQLLLMYDKMGK